MDVFSNVVLSLNAAAWTKYIVDIVVAVCLLGYIIVGIKKGFINSLFGFASTLVSLILAISLCKVVLNATDGLFGLQKSLEKSCENMLDGLKGFDVDISNQNLEDAVEDKSLPSFILSLVIKQYKGKELEAGTTLAMLAGNVLAKLIATLITGIVLFFLAKLVLRLLRGLIMLLVSKLSLLGAVNHLLGGVLGLIQGALILYAVLSVLSLIPADGIAKYLDSSVLAGLLFKYNPLNYILGWLI